MINMLKTSIDTAPPPSATLPFTHPKKAPAPEPHTKVVCTKVRESGICKLMSVRSHAAQFSELNSNAMEHCGCRLVFQCTLAPGSCLVKSVLIKF